MLKTVIICDRCGCQYEKEDTKSGKFYDYKIECNYLQKRDDESRSRKMYDLCPYCSSELDDWISKNVPKI